jgi:hypothetical protein
MAGAACRAPRWGAVGLYLPGTLARQPDQECVDDGRLYCGVEHPSRMDAQVQRRSKRYPELDEVGMSVLSKGNDVAHADQARFHTAQHGVRAAKPGPPCGGFAASPDMSLTDTSGFWQTGCAGAGSATGDRGGTALVNRDHTSTAARQSCWARGFASTTARPRVARRRLGGSTPTSTGSAGTGLGSLTCRTSQSRCRHHPVGVAHRVTCETGRLSPAPGSAAFIWLT